MTAVSVRSRMRSARCASFFVPARWAFRLPVRQKTTKRKITNIIVASPKRTHLLTRNSIPSGTKSAGFVAAHHGPRLITTAFTTCDNIPGLAEFPERAQESRCFGVRHTT